MENGSKALRRRGFILLGIRFDRERYEDIAAIANEMLSVIGDVPIERISDLVPDFARGYATPKSTCVARLSSRT
jgi:hypothetical protein